MKNLLIVLALILAGVAALGFYRGWFEVSTADADHKSKVTISVDKDKIEEDEQKLKDASHSLKAPAAHKAAPEPEGRP
jgi:hypothetical protein